MSPSAFFLKAVSKDARDGSPLDFGWYSSEIETPSKHLFGLSRAMVGALTPPDIPAHLSCSQGYG